MRLVAELQHHSEIGFSANRASCHGMGRGASPVEIKLTHYQTTRFLDTLFYALYS